MAGCDDRGRAHTHTGRAATGMGGWGWGGKRACALSRCGGERPWVPCLAGDANGHERTHFVSTAVCDDPFCCPIVSWCSSSSMNSFCSWHLSR